MSTLWPDEPGMRAPGICIVAVFTAISACLPPENRDRHASAVESYIRAPDRDPGRENPALDRALGPPDGRTVAIEKDASLTLRFFRAIHDGDGRDLRVYEIGDDGAQARIAVSGDGETFVEFGALAEGPATELDLDHVHIRDAYFVRITGVDDLGLDPGFDLDAVEAMQ